ncbi:gamma-glutamyl hydrolase-like [Paramacrobiotus metropolitanus]|uniref:gamma-glutamyl hydrolase-like n=1 Tax=Paramacrobiotus metropolitanus TaxID=2943436 RepID=UPI002445C556|nr:gamma-glutamyl hydrolase-like [Paramacrobiotus metropolitanus]
MFLKIGQRPYSNIAEVIAIVAIVLITILHRGHADVTPDERSAVSQASRDAPVIGILAESVVSKKMQSTLGVKRTASFIAASYVKWAETAGARVVPILLNQPESYYANLMSKINGVIFPGGAVSLSRGGYATAGRTIFELAEKMNQLATYFPIWGTCLGFELLTVVMANRNVLASCSAKKLHLPISFQSGYETSKIFSAAPKEIISMLANEPITVNSHHKCLTPTNMTLSGLSSRLRNLGNSVSRDGIVFSAVFEDMRYPFYGVQFHPEKPGFEPGSYSTHAVQAGNYFGTFFVNEARKNGQRFASKQEENAFSIHNWAPTPAPGTVYHEIYLFR